MTAHNPTPLSDQFQAAMLDWARSDEQARKLEELKSSVFARMTKERGDMSLAAAERDVKASQEWRDIVEEVIQARTGANKAWAHVEALRMRHVEWRIGQQMMMGYSDLPFAFGDGK